MSNCSPAMSMRRDEHQPRLEMRSPLATATRNPAPPEKMTLAHSAALVSMKLWVEPESRSACSEVEPMATETCMVRPVLGWMPVSTANEMVDYPHPRRRQAAPRRTGACMPHDGQERISHRI
jgi:hypothetical protein